MQRKLSHLFYVGLLCVLISACSSTPAAVESAPPPPTATTGQAVSSAPVSGQRTFVIVPATSKASYSVDEEFFGGALAKYGINAGKSDTVGTTQEIAGQLQLNLDDLSAALGDNRFTVQMNTLTSDRSLRDGWIRDNGPRFNDYPEATFVATAIEGAPATYTEGDEVSFKLLGDMTIREITQPATFDVSAKLVGDTITGVATTRLLMSDFGITPPDFANTLTVLDEFAIEVQFTAQEQTQ